MPHVYAKPVVKFALTLPDDDDEADAVVDAIVQAITEGVEWLAKEAKLGVHRGSVTVSWEDEWEDETE